MSNFAFEVSMYNFEKLSPVISKARVRIFYTGLNRNYTYITDDFAKKLLDTLPYTPVVGRFEDGDFTNHGRGEQLQVYGVIPENPNIRWEDHTDNDGVTRSYACADVYLFTGRFPEAKMITTAKQSMELYDKSVKGEWIYDNGKKCFRFDEGCFIGVCALGSGTEPCFEGAAFYEYSENLKEILEEIKKYDNGGKATMDLKFKLSDAQKLEMLFDLINSEGFMENVVCQVYDDYALCYNYADNKYFRAYYKKNDETDSIEITEKIDAYVLDVTEAEFNAIKKLGEMSDNNYSAIEQEVTAYRQSQFEIENGEGEGEEGETEEAEETTDEIEEVEVEKETEEVEEENGETEEVETEDDTTEEVENEFESKISKLNTQIDELNEKISTYELENKELKQYKEAAENAKKETFLNKYSAKLPKDVVEEFKSKIADFTLDDFKKEVSTKVLEVNENDIFNKEQNLLPADNFEVNEQKASTPGERLLANYLKNKKD